MKKVLIPVIAAMTLSVSGLALAGTPVTSPALGLGYTSIGLSGHTAHPGLKLFASQHFANDVRVSGSATFARGFYGMDANVGQFIPLSRRIALEPLLDAGFLSMNYNRQEVGYNVSTVNAGYGFTYQQTTPYSYTVPASIQDFYAMAGANLEYRITRRVRFSVGGGFGHTLMVLNGAGGQVYRGLAGLTAKLSQRWSSDIDVSYLHLPGAAITGYGAGVSCHF